MQVCGPQEDQNASTHPGGHIGQDHGVLIKPRDGPNDARPWVHPNSSPQLHSRVTRQDQQAWERATMTGGPRVRGPHHPPCPQRLSC